MKSLDLDRRILQSWSVFFSFVDLHVLPAFKLPQERLAQRGEMSELKWMGLLGTRLRDKPSMCVLAKWFLSVMQN